MTFFKGIILCLGGLITMLQRAEASEFVTFDRQVKGSGASSAPGIAPCVLMAAAIFFVGLLAGWFLRQARMWLAQPQMSSKSSQASLDIELEDLTINAVRDRLRLYRRSTDGSKAELISRLKRDEPWW